MACFGNNIKARVGVVSELPEKGSQQALDFAFGTVSEVEVIICDQS
jgi:hypothetical protein